MNYFSSRDEKNLVKSSQAILKGMAKDGGLFVFESFLKFSDDEIKQLVNLKYKDIAFLILKKFLTDFNEKDLEDAVKKAYEDHKFSCEDVFNISDLDDNLSVLELWHGPTLAFKDIALQFLSQILQKALNMQNEFENVLILTATSGDTGKAALEGFKNVDKTKIIVFYPEFGVSYMQKMSMITQNGDNLNVLAVNGNFDDAQRLVKQLLVSDDFKVKLAKHKILISTANSINLGRLVAQIVYYFAAYCDMVKRGRIKFQDRVNIIVPTGNFGNVLACYYAKKMGLYVEDIIVASNQNSILTDFINTGFYDINRNFYKTISPSMDILISSNLERLLFDLYKDSKSIVNLYDCFNKTGRFQISGEILKKLQNEFCAGFCDDLDTKKEILKVLKKYNYLSDPHTAVAFNVFEQYSREKRNNNKNLIVSTASPLKFATDVVNAISPFNKFSDKEAVEEICRMCKISLPKLFVEMGNSKVRFTKKVEKNCDQKIILKELNLTVN